MPQYEGFLLVGLSCLIVAGLLLLGSVGTSSLRRYQELRRDQREEREAYQLTMRGIITAMVEATDTTGDLEWALHSLIFDYRRLS